MSIRPRDTNKKGTLTRSQARKNPILAKEIEETSQGSLKPTQKTLEHSAKNSQYPETSSN